MEKVNQNKFTIKIKYGNMKEFENLAMSSERNAKAFISEIKKLRPDAEIQIISPN